MEFLETFLPTFFIWQFFSLSPFALTKHSLQPKTNRIHNFLSIFSIIIQMVIFVYGFLYYQHYTSLVDRSMVLFIGDLLSMTLIRFISITIVIESWLKRSHQIDFLTKIEHIDRIIHTNLLIDLRYKLQKKLNLRNLFNSIGAQVCLELSVILLAWLTQNTKLQIFCAFYTIPLFLCMMRYQQFISYVNLLRIRFEALNECIERLKSTEVHSSMNLIHLNDSSKFIANFSHFKNVRNDKNTKTFLIVYELKQLQKVYRLLIEANRMLCKLFHWSMLLNVGNDFVNLILNMYCLIDNFVQDDSKLELIGVTAWATFNIIVLSSLTNACQLACYEVI